MLADFRTGLILCGVISTVVGAAVYGWWRFPTRGQQLPGDWGEDIGFLIFLSAFGASLLVSLLVLGIVLIIRVFL